MCRDTIVVGSIIFDAPTQPNMPPGHVRGYDVRTGRQKWIFHTIPQDGEEGVETWEHDSWKISGNTNVWSTISALQLFDEVFFVTKGGPLGRTSVVVFYVYRLAFEQGLGGLSLAGYAAAIAYLLFLVILALTLIQFWLGNRVIHYRS